MKKLTMIARIILGFIFAASAVAFFVTNPPPMEGAVADFFKGLAGTGYFFYLLKGTELVCGVLLLLGLYVPLALVILAPIVINIVLVHAFLMPSGLPMAVILGLLETYLAFFSPEYSPAIKTLFNKNTQ